MEKVISTIPKNATEQVRVALTEYKGHDLIDLRVYYQAEDDTWKPTRKGITFKTDVLDDVVKALQKAVKEAEGD